MVARCGRSDDGAARPPALGDQMGLGSGGHLGRPSELPGSGVCHGFGVPRSATECGGSAVRGCSGEPQPDPVGEPRREFESMFDVERIQARERERRGEPVEVDQGGFPGTGVSFDPFHGLGEVFGGAGPDAKQQPSMQSSSFSHVGNGDVLGGGARGSQQPSSGCGFDVLGGGARGSEQPSSGSLLGALGGGAGGIQPLSGTGLFNGLGGGAGGIQQPSSGNGNGFGGGGPGGNHPSSGFDGLGGGAGGNQPSSGNGFGGGGHGGNQPSSGGFGGGARGNQPPSGNGTFFGGAGHGGNQRPSGLTSLIGGLGGGQGGFDPQSAALIGSLMSQNESIRSVDLPMLPELTENEVGPLTAGDWVCQVTPLMRDLSQNSPLWWDAALNESLNAYNLWLGSDPMGRLRIAPQTPLSFSAPPLARVEQRGQALLLRALPPSLKEEVISTRQTGSVNILFKIWTRYQPGGLAERGLLLRSLVDPGTKSFSSVGDVVAGLRNWRRWLIRTGELNIAVPDATLLVSALDKFAQGLMRCSPQAAFRLNAARASLQVDVNPSLPGVAQFAEVLMAEAESAYHGGSSLQTNSTTKVKALGAAATDGRQQQSVPVTAKENVKPDGRVPYPCRFFLSDGGCKKGRACTYVHEWGDTNKFGRCWCCGSSQHAKKDCPALDQKGDNQPIDGKKSTPAVKKEKPKVEKPPQVKKSEVEKNDVAGGGDEKPEKTDSPVKEESKGPDGSVVGGLVSDAATLLKSLSVKDTQPSLKVVRLRSVEVGSNQMALLDGGATHILRMARDDQEYECAVPVRVELASGVTMLRQIKETGTLLTREPTQMIIPLGRLISLGYRVDWKKEGFKLKDPDGSEIPTCVEDACPLVDHEIAEELVKQLEEFQLEHAIRVKFLRGDPGEGLSSEVIEQLKDLKNLFPDAPDHILARLLPRRRWRGEDLPWNRRMRRKWRDSRSLILHLFSGPKEGWWKQELEHSGRSMICVDTVLHEDQNLLRDSVFDYIGELCDGGSIDAMLLGPPCRTLSRMRYNGGGGPPPLRSRYGEERFGFKNLDEFWRNRVIDDSVLWMRSLWLMVRAKRARLRPVLFVKEQPQDPNTYLPPEKQGDFPCYFEFPEWKSVESLIDLKLLNFDQGRLGHVRQKPTTLATNVKSLDYLDELRVDHTFERKPLPDLKQRIAESSGWSAWAPGLKKAIVEALKLELGNIEDPSLKKMTPERWKQHVAMDHMPFSKDCLACQVGSGRGKKHLRIPSPDTYTLSVDLCGKFAKGKDQEIKNARYMVIGVFTVPAFADGKACLKASPKEEDILAGEGAALPEEIEELFVAEEEEHHDPPEDQQEDDGNIWLAKVEDSIEEQELRGREFEVRNYTMVEIVADRSLGEVQYALAKMVAKLNYLGFPVRRLHRAAEFTSAKMRRWAADRGMLRTFTEASDWKSNGRCESEVGMVRRSVNTLMKTSGSKMEDWPLLARHAGERRGRQQLTSMGFEVAPLLPYNQRVVVHTKSWEDFQGHWRERKKEAWVRGPDIS